MNSKIVKHISSLILFSLVLPVSHFLLNEFSNNKVSKANAVDAGLYDYSKVRNIIPTGYYDSLDMSKGIDAFKDDLCNVISKDYHQYTYDYVGSNILPKSDMDPDYPINIKCIYSGESLASGWDREHIWCKSYGFENDVSSEPYTDAHHLRAANSYINTTRNDTYFGETTSNLDIFGNYHTGDIFTPRDESKGSVARMILYMAVRYKNLAPYNFVIKEDAVKDKNPHGTAIFGNLSTLLKWHYQYPVSVDEIYRNNVVYTYQNNRNPFIDHPEYVSKCFDTSSINGYFVDTSVNNEEVSTLKSVISTIPSKVSLDNLDLVMNAYKLYSELNNNEKSSLDNDSFNKLTNSVKEIRQLKIDKDNEGVNHVYNFAEPLEYTYKNGYKQNSTYKYGGGDVFFSSAMYVNSCARLSLHLGNVSDYAIASSSSANTKDIFPFAKEDKGNYFLTSDIYENVSSIYIHSPCYKSLLSNFKGYSIFIKEINGNYREVKSSTTYETKLVATLEGGEALTGQVGLVIYGASASITIQTLKISTSEADENVTNINELKTKANLSFNYNFKTVTSDISNTTNATFEFNSDISNKLGFGSDLSVIPGSLSSSVRKPVIENNYFKLMSNNSLTITAKDDNVISFFRLNIEAGHTTGIYYSLNNGVDYIDASKMSNRDINANTSTIILKTTNPVWFNSITIKYGCVFDVKMRFGVTGNVNLIDSSIDGYGVFTANTELLVGDTITNIFDECYKFTQDDSKLLDLLASNSINTECKERKDNNGKLNFNYINNNHAFRFNACLNFNETDYAKNISAVAYFIINGKYVLLNERNESVSSLSSKYIGYTGDIGNSLSYLASK